MDLRCLVHSHCTSIFAGKISDSMTALIYPLISFFKNSARHPGSTGGAACDTGRQDALGLMVTGVGDAGNIAEVKASSLVSKALGEVSFLLYLLCREMPVWGMGV